jgi:isoquinoline 1-oxidoreductase
VIELERYELNEGPAYRFTPDRRDVLKLLGGGLAVFLLWDRDAQAQESGRSRRGGNEMPQDIAAWLHIGPDGAISVYTGKTEVGQNIRTSLTQAVAEELHCAPSSILMVMADTDLTPYDMGTFGSRTTPFMAPQLRKVAAVARETLIDMAAVRMQVNRSELAADNGCIHDTGTGAKLAYGELTHGGQIAKTISADTILTAPVDWKTAGQPLEKVNAREIVTGRHRYASDFQRPGMLFGRVLRPESYEAKLVSLDASQTTAIVVRDGDFVGVVAADEFAAEQALQALKPQWKSEPQTSSRDLFAYLKANAETGGPAAHETGSVEDALRSSDHQLDATYTIAYIAHVPLEPRAAVAEWKADRLTVWTGTQVPFGVKGELAEAFGVPQDKVRVIVPDTGSGYGGKHTGECAIEAARLAKAAGRPVKLVWTREEEFTWAYFRPAGVIDVRGGASKDGLLTAWEFHNYNSGPSGIATPYDVAHQRIQFHPTKSPLRQGSYRGLAATANHFARECHMDDLAHAAGFDPLDFRRRNLKNPRMQAVLDAAADRFHAQADAPKKGRGTGVSCGFEKGGYVACCAQVMVEAVAKVRIERVVISFECGAIVNPKHLENQVEGSVMMALGGALFEGIAFENGRLLNGRLSRYRVPRFSDLPAIETVLVNRRDLPSAGAGETPIVGLGPAVGNAIFQASGVRARSLPMLPALAIGRT